MGDRSKENVARKNLLDLKVLTRINQVHVRLRNLGVIRTDALLRCFNVIADIQNVRNPASPSHPQCHSSMTPPSDSPHKRHETGVCSI